MEICKNISSGKYFIYIDEIGNSKALFVTPMGEIKALKIKLFSEPDYRSEDDLISQKLITELQEKKYHGFIESQLTEKSDQIDEIEKNTVESLLFRASKHLKSYQTDSLDNEYHLSEMSTMSEENRSKIKALATLTRDEIGVSEESVKINFAVRLLEYLGHSRMDFEHKYKDILIKKGLPRTATVIVETKSYDKDLTNALGQLERYCHEERPLIGIISNGTEIIIFSYSWRFRPSFNKQLVYRISRKELKYNNIIKILESILLRANLKDCSAIKNIMVREQEIENAEKKVNEIKSQLTEDENNLEEQIQEKSKDLQKIVEEIENLKRKKDKIVASKKIEIDHIWDEIQYYPLKKEERRRRIIPNSQHTSSERIGYKESYRKQLDNPNTLPSKMKKFIQERGEVTGEELTLACVEQLGCISETSGSIGASLTTLQNEGYVVVHGRGPLKRIVWAGGQ